MNKTFRVHIKDQQSRWKHVYDGLLLEPVLTPKTNLFNLYILVYDIPVTIVKKFQYADDTELAIQQQAFDWCEGML